MGAFLRCGGTRVQRRRGARRGCRRRRRPRTPCAGCPSPGGSPASTARIRGTTDGIRVTVESPPVR